MLLFAGLILHSACQSLTHCFIVCICLSLNANTARITVPRQLILHLVAEIASPIRLVDGAELGSGDHDERVIMMKVRVGVMRNGAAPSSDVGVGHASPGTGPEKGRSS